MIPEHARGTLQALRRLVGEVGGLVGPLVAGATSDLLSPGTGFLLLVFRVPETLRPEAQPQGK